MIDSSLLRELFLQRLPANVQMILASADLMTQDKLAEMADRMIDIATPTISFVSISSEGGDFRKNYSGRGRRGIANSGKITSPKF